MEKKKATRAELEKRIKNAELIIEKGKGYKHISFTDIGVSISVCKDYVTCSTNFHHHVWNRLTSNDISAPYLYFDYFMDVVLSHLDDIKIKLEDKSIVYSFEKLIGLTSLTKAEHILINIVEKFIYVNNDPLYKIGTDDVDITALMLSFNTLRAKGATFLEDYEGDIMKNDFYNRFVGLLRYYSINMDIDASKKEDVRKKIMEIEAEAHNKIASYIEENGGKVNDSIIIKTTESESTEETEKIEIL